ncbi:MAG TPA: hypothetical protein VM616_05295 [Gammaproteobacteria bacterium]|nr:hypothetical protein [Gammaproteobacteria bacterium]
MYSPEAQPTYVGVNVAALIALVYLIWRSRIGAARPAAQGA